MLAFVTIRLIEVKICKVRNSYLTSMIKPECQNI